MDSLGSVVPAFAALQVRVDVALGEALQRGHVPQVLQVRLRRKRVVQSVPVRPRALVEVVLLEQLVICDWCENVQSLHRLSFLVHLPKVPFDLPSPDEAASGT